MAVVPTTEQTVFPTGNPNEQQQVSRYALRGSALPESIAGLGSEIGRAGERYSASVASAQDQQDRLSYVYATSNLLKGKIDADEKFAQDPDYATWVPRYNAQMGKLAESYGSTISNPVLRAQFQQSAMFHIAEGAKGLAVAAKGKETDAGLGWLSDTMDANRDTYLRASDQLTRDTAFKASQSAIVTAQQAGWIDPLKASELRQKQAESWPLAYLATLPPRARAAILAPAGSGVASAPLGPGVSAAVAQAAKAHGEDAETLARTIQIESGGDPGVVNPSSGAFGLIQAIGSTAQHLGINKNSTVAEQANAGAVLQSENRAALTKGLGRGPTPAEIYLAHQQGAEGAMALISFPDKNAVQALADGAGVPLEQAKASIIGNGGTLDMTAGQFAGMWQKRFDDVPMKSVDVGPVGQPPAVGADGQLVFNKTGGLADSIRPDVRAELYGQTLKQISADDREAQAEAEHAQREQEKALAAHREAFTSDFGIQLARGQKGYGDIEAAYQNGDLSAESRTRFTLALDEQMKKGEKEAALMARAAAAGNGGAPLDPKNADDKKAVNLLYDATKATWANLEPDQVFAQQVNFAYQKGIVPEEMQAGVRGGLRSGNPQQAEAAAKTITTLRSLNPQLLNDFAAEDISLGNQIASLIDYGVPADKAIEQAQEALKVSPMQRDARGTAFDALVKATPDTKWIEGKLNSVWTSDPTVDPVMAGEFHALSKQEYEKTGDIEAARQTALDEITNVWGRTEVGGDRRYMKFAPEKYYGVPEMSPSENAKWMNEQLLSDVTKDAMRDPANPITLDRLLVVPDPTRTGPGGAPRYRVAIKGTDGVYYGMTKSNGDPELWNPDWSISAERTRQDAARQAKVDAARKMREAILKGQLPALRPGAPGGRGPEPPAVPDLSAPDAVP